MNIRITTIAKCCYPIIAGAMSFTGHFGSIGFRTCQQKLSWHTKVCRMSWLKGIDNETTIARLTFVNNSNTTFVRTYNTYSNRFYLDRTGSLHIYNLTLNDVGNYSNAGYYSNVCMYKSNDDLVVQLDVVGELLILSRQMHTKYIWFDWHILLF